MEMIKEGRGNEKIPINTPPESLHALLEAARKHGRYPLNPEYFS